MARRTKGSGSVFKPKRSRFWWISYLSNGKRQFESSKSTRKGDAQALLLHRIGDINHGLPVTPKMGRTTVGDGLRTVVNDLRLNGRKAVLCGRCKIACCGVEGHSHEAARRIARIQAHFPAHRLLGTISTSDLMAYAAQRLSQGAAAASVNHELGMIRRAFRLAIRARELAVMPHIPMLALNNARQGFLDADQLDDIVAHLPSSLHEERGVAVDG
jgi:hypothetical protein